MTLLPPKLNGISCLVSFNDVRCLNELTNNSLNLTRPRLGHRAMIRQIAFDAGAHVGLWALWVIEKVR
jgi:hypothetical protein